MNLSFHFFFISYILYINFRWHFLQLNWNSLQLRSTGLHDLTYGAQSCITNSEVKLSPIVLDFFSSLVSNFNFAVQIEKNYKAIA